MSNEQYLLASYSVVGLSAIGLGWVTARWLRRSLSASMDGLLSANWARVLRRLFSPSLWLVALAGFITVSYRSCDGPNTFEEIVEDRSHLVRVNQEQLDSVLMYLSGALVFWATVLTIGWCLSPGPVTPPRAGGGGLAMPSDTIKKDRVKGTE